MAIQDEITRIANAKTTIANAITAKGGTVSGTIDTFASAISALSTSSEGGSTTTIHDIPFISIGINGDMYGSEYNVRINPFFICENNTFLFIADFALDKTNKEVIKSDTNIYGCVNYIDDNTINSIEGINYENYKNINGIENDYTGKTNLQLDILFLIKNSDSLLNAVYDRCICNVDTAIGLDIKDSEGNDVSDTEFLEHFLKCDNGIIVYDAVIATLRTKTD